MGRAAALLGNRRAVAGALLLAALLAYYAFVAWLPNVPTPVDVLFVGFVLIPAVFALVMVALPLREHRGRLAVALAFAALAVVAELGGLQLIANFAKLGAATFVAFWFLGYFETVLWVALVALLIPGVDALSVWRGPTRHIIEERPQVFTVFSFAFPLPGERQVGLRWSLPREGGAEEFFVVREPGPAEPLNEQPIRDRDGDGRTGFLEAELDARRDYTYRIRAGRGADAAVAEAPAPWRDADGEPRDVPDASDPRAPREVTVTSTHAAARLGIPDLLFFALFLAAADRWALRTRATWVAMAASFGITLAGAYFLWFDGLPALPLLALAFLLVNADLLWRAFRARGTESAA